MSDDLALMLFVFGPIALVCLGAAIVDWEHKHPRKKPNVRLPRETLWERTHRYYEDRS